MQNIALRERGVDHVFCGGFAAEPIGSKRVTTVTSFTISSKGDQMLIHVRVIDVITNEDPAEVLKSMPEFTRVSSNPWLYRYRGTTVKMETPQHI